MQKKLEYPPWVSELVRLKTGNYIYFIAQANLHFGELIISIIVVFKDR